MADSDRMTLTPSRLPRLVATSSITVWIAFILVHLLLGLLNLYAPGQPIGDVAQVYKFWTDQALDVGFWVGIDSQWVYPVLALVPMVTAGLFGDTFYTSSWLTMVMLLNAIAFGVLTGWGRSRQHLAIAWWWVAFLLALGPIALGRIDSITVPLALIAVLVAATRPSLAAVLLTVATWIKVWPAAILVAMVIASRDRRRIAIAAASVTAVIITIALLLGAGSNVLSFVGQQAGRGLQIEAPVSTFWLWLAAGGVAETGLYYDFQILTFQVKGPGVEVASALMTPLLGLVMIGLCALGAIAVRRGAVSTDLLPVLCLALVTALISINKVGSPQFIAWLAVPVILGLATKANGTGRSFRTPALLALVLAGLTHAVYPYLYVELLLLNPAMLAVLTVRNLLELVLLGWSVRALWKLSQPDPASVGATKTSAVTRPLQVR